MSNIYSKQQWLDLALNVFGREQYQDEGPHKKFLCCVAPLPPFLFKKKWLDQAEKLGSHILRILNKTTSSRETYEEEEKKLNNMNQDGHILF